MNTQKLVLVNLVGRFRISVSVFEENEHNFICYHYSSVIKRLLKWLYEDNKIKVQPINRDFKIQLIDIACWHQKSARSAHIENLVLLNLTITNHKVLNLGL